MQNDMDEQIMLPPPKRGRPTLLTPQVMQTVCAFLSEGVHFETACNAAGISRQDAYRWLKRGEDGDEPYEEFLLQVTRARAMGEVALHRKVRDGGKGSHGAQFLLERIHREHYGNIIRTEHTGADGKAIEISAKSVSDMSDEELLRLADAGRSISGASPQGTLTP